MYILGVDIGNTNTVFGLFNDSRDLDILHDWRTVTRRDRTSDELGIYLLGFLEFAGVKPASIRTVVYSSVVPSFSPIVEHMIRHYFKTEPLRVDHTRNLPIRLRYPQPQEIGADRLVNASAAAHIYGGNVICVDLGTATTFSVIRDGEFVGGSIAPGLKISIETLSNRTAQLPPIEFKRPPGGVIGESTVQALQSGFFYGWLGMLREIIQTIRNERSDLRYQVVATGGLSALFQTEAEGLLDHVDPLLTLKGLKIIYQHQQQLPQKKG
ncbi:MAG: type III pantothenate kinase [Leptospirales bacterium]